jgi:hypothetical protein
MKRLAALASVILLMIGVLAGCQKTKSDTFEPTQSCLYVRDDGTAAGAEVTAFSESYYSLSELKTYVEELVTAYNQEKAGLAYAYVVDLPEGAGTLPVSISRLSQSNDKVVLVLECATPADYIAINDLDLQSTGLKSVSVSTVDEMKAAGRSLSGSMVDVKGESVTKDKATKKGSYHVVVCEGATLLQVQGEVKYMSSNVTYVNSSTVQTPAGEVSYIIYK